MLVDQNPDGTTTDHPVKEADILAGQETRFAYNGSRIELRDIVEDAARQAATVPLTLEFAEANGDAPVRSRSACSCAASSCRPRPQPGQTSEAPK